MSLGPLVGGGWGGDEGFLWGRGGAASGKHNSDPGQSRAGPFLGALGPVPCPKGRGLPGLGLERSPTDGLLHVASPGWADTVTVTLLQPNSLHLQVVGPWGAAPPHPTPGEWAAPRRTQGTAPQEHSHARQLAHTPRSDPALPADLGSPNWQFPAFAKPGHPEDVGGAASGPRVWWLLPGKNPPQPLPLVLWRLPGRVGSVAHAQGAGPLHRPTEAMTISFGGGDPGAQGPPSQPRTGRAATLPGDVYPLSCLLQLASASSSPARGSRFPLAPFLLEKQAGTPAPALPAPRLLEGSVRPPWMASICPGRWGPEHPPEHQLPGGNPLPRLHDCTTRDRGRTVQLTRDQKQQPLHPSLWPESAPWHPPHGNRT